MPDENKSDKNKGSGDDANKILTVEEIQAIAKKAEAALAGDDDKDKNKGGDDKDKSDNDDEFVLDPKNIDTDKTLKYIDKLKDENARRRIANKKADDKLGKLTTELTSAKDALNAAADRIKGFDDKTEAEKAKEKSDLEAAKKTIDDLSKKVGDLEATNTENQQKLVETNKRVQVQERENMITNLVRQQQVEFSSGFEQGGLIQSLSKMDNEGFLKNNEEVIYDVMKFIKDKKAHVDRKTPGPGPGNRQTQTPLGDEIKALLKEKDLSKEQNKRLDELLAMTQDTT